MRWSRRGGPGRLSQRDGFGCLYVTFANADGRMVIINLTEMSRTVPTELSFRLWSSAYYVLETRRSSPVTSRRGAALRGQITRAPNSCRFLLELLYNYFILE